MFERANFSKPPKRQPFPRSRNVHLFYPSIFALTLLLTTRVESLLSTQKLFPFSFDVEQLGKRRRNFGRPDISEDSNIGLNTTFEEVFNDQSYETFDIPYRSDSQASSYRKRYPGRSASREPFVNIDSLEPGTNRHQFVDINELTLPSQKRHNHNLRTPNKPRRRKFSLDTRSAGYPTRYEPSSRPEHR